MTGVLLGVVLGLVAAIGGVSGGPLTVTEEAWFEVTFKEDEGSKSEFKGRFTIALFGDAAPLTVLNFASITKGYRRQKTDIPGITNIFETLTYKLNAVHRVVPDFLIQMGDIVKGDGTAGTSIYGPKFNDEEFIISHKAPGVVSMANYGPDTNASQFFILLSKARWLDNKHVAFGKVIQGFDVVEKIGEVKVNPNTAVPLTKVIITDCGLNNIERKYEMTEEQFLSTEDA